MLEDIYLYVHSSSCTVSEQNLDVFFFLTVTFVLTRYYAKLKKMEEEREQELASKYRDRVSYQGRKMVMRTNCSLI